MIKSFKQFINEEVSGTELVGPIGPAYGETGLQNKTVTFHDTNVILSELDNRGVHLWKVKLATVPLVLGQAEYNYTADTTNYPQDINDVLEAYVRNNTVPAFPVDISLTNAVLKDVSPLILDDISLDKALDIPITTK